MTKWKNLYAAGLSGFALVSLIGLPLAKDNLALPSTTTSFVHQSADEKIPVEINALADLNPSKLSPVAGQWLASVRSDTLGEKAVFEHLSTFEPLNGILKKGIVSYDRKALRSPSYHDERGYDLLVYDIRHPLSGVSRVMASLEKGPEGLGYIIKIVFLTLRDGENTAELVQFDGEQLSSQKQVAWAEADALFLRELKDASTLMSASIH